MATTIKNQYANIPASVLSEVDRAAEQLASRFRERTLRALARGTNDDISTKAKLAVTLTDDSIPLIKRVETALRAKPCTPEQLAKLTGTPLPEVFHLIRRMRNMKCPTRNQDDADEARLIFNIGTEAEPRFIWVIGDETPTQEVRDIVETLITLKAYTFADLYAATGVRRGRLSGVLVDFQRDGRKIKNEGGTDRRYRWSMTPLAR